MSINGTKKRIQFAIKANKPLFIILSQDKIGYGNRK